MFYVLSINFRPQTEMGKGIKCRVGKDSVTIGTCLYFHEMGIRVSPAQRKMKNDLEGQGKTVVNVGVNNQLVAFVAIADTPKVLPACVHISAAVHNSLSGGDSSAAVTLT